MGRPKSLQVVEETPYRRRIADTRRWYAAAVLVSAPWWLLPLPVIVYLLAYVAALAVAAAWTPAVTLRTRVSGGLVALALTFLLWLAIIVYVGNRYGDAEWQEETKASSERD